MFVLCFSKKENTYFKILSAYLVFFFSPFYVVVGAIFSFISELFSFTSCIRIRMDSCGSGFRRAQIMRIRNTG